ncbi:MAG: hypothetical protein V2A79_19880 [Planctomycetota bacterium]
MTPFTILTLGVGIVAFVAILLFIVQPWADHRDAELRRRAFDEAFLHHRQGK